MLQELVVARLGLVVVTLEVDTQREPVVDMLVVVMQRGLVVVTLVVMQREPVVADIVADTPVVVTVVDGTNKGVRDGFPTGQRSGQVGN
jgi:hypothetical protein